MATSFSKNYSVDVTFSRSDGGTIADDDVQSAELREEIIKAIGQIASRTKGIYVCHPSEVSES